MNELTFKARLKDPDRQRFFVTYLAGKMAGLILAVGLIFSVGTLLAWQVAHAQDDTAQQITSVINGSSGAASLPVTSSTVCSVSMASASSSQNR